MKNFFKSILLISLISLLPCFNFSLALPEDNPTISAQEALQNLERAKSKYSQSPKTTTPQQETPSTQSPTQNPPTQTPQTPQTNQPQTPETNSTPSPVQQQPNAPKSKNQTPTNRENTSKPKETEKKVEEKPKEEAKTENKEENKEEKSTENEENKTESTVPKDLPSVNESEILLPQVVASQSTPESKNNLTTGLIAWSLIAAGILIVLIVLIKGRKSPDVDLNKLNLKSRKRKKGKILPRSYYRKKY